VASSLRSHQIFASLDPDHALAVMKTLAEKAPAVFAQAVAAAGAAMKARPVYLRRQPFPKRAEAVRRTLSRPTANQVAGEILAVYFLECRKELLLEWLDAVGLEHEDGTLLADAPPEPEEALLRKAAEVYLAADADRDRAVLLAAFAAQDAIDWPVLDETLRKHSAAP
jgi:hypothetical protein